ncbi:unnamed protein product [Protopolystoma xenopodis]|uniref:Uncharacterized protein n=1 Tax=Protopolystoma xenopodis TaxID=117903 RepID=A0A448WK06_9PLAT|nr:unnamed protein product [Protopolystoma xenopodis]
MADWGHLSSVPATRPDVRYPFDLIIASAILLLILVAVAIGLCVMHFCAPNYPDSSGVGSVCCHSGGPTTVWHRLSCCSSRVASWDGRVAKHHLLKEHPIEEVDGSEVDGIETTPASRLPSKLSTSGRSVVHSFGPPSRHRAFITGLLRRKLSGLLSSGRSRLSKRHFHMRQAPVTGIHTEAPVLGPPFTPWASCGSVHPSGMGFYCPGQLPYHLLTTSNQAYPLPSQTTLSSSLPPGSVCSGGWCLSPSRGCQPHETCRFATSPTVLTPGNVTEAGRIMLESVLTNSVCYM